MPRSMFKRKPVPNESTHEAMRHVLFFIQLVSTVRVLGSSGGFRPSYAFFSSAKKERYAANAWGVSKSMGWGFLCVDSLLIPSPGGEGTSAQQLGRPARVVGRLIDARFRCAYVPSTSQRSIGWQPWLGERKVEGERALSLRRLTGRFQARRWGD